MISDKCLYVSAGRGEVSSSTARMHRLRALLVRQRETLNHEKQVAFYQTNGDSGKARRLNERKHRSMFGFPFKEKAGLVGIEPAIGTERYGGHYFTPTGNRFRWR